MNCEICKGACCESFELPLTLVRPGDDMSRWLGLHATVLRDPKPVGSRLSFECRCTLLTPEGLCGNYENRPDLCRNYLPGSDACIATVRRRRTPEQFEAIANG